MAFKECANISVLWECMESDVEEMEPLLNQTSHTFQAVVIFIYILCLFNNTVCFIFFTQNEFESRSIPTLLRMKYVSNVMCMTWWIPYHIYLNRFGSLALYAPNTALCAILLFFRKYFSSCSNWAELASALFLFIKGVYPDRSAILFKTDKLAYISISVIMVLSFGINVGELLKPGAIRCHYKGIFHCTYNIVAKKNFFFFLMSFWFPIFICLTLLSLLVGRRMLMLRKKIRLDVTFQRTYKLGVASTCVFIFTTLPFVTGMTVITFGKVQTCQYYHAHLFRTLLTIKLLRFLAFIFDWIVFLFVSKYFRVQTLHFLQTQFKRFSKSK